MSFPRPFDSLMTKHPLTIGYEETIRKANEMMSQHRFRHLPVTDHLGEVIGILSDRDIQRAMEARKTGIDIELVIAPHKKVKDYMSWPPHTVRDDGSLADALRFMISEKISAILITSSLTGKIRGILTSEDLIRDYLRILETPSHTETFLPGSDA
jgi:CBS domain-containing protein